MQQRIVFENRNGHKLAGILHLPDLQQPQAYALFAHCFTCTKNINSATKIANTLADSGIATLRFDFTGLGASQGDFSDSSFSTDISDLVDAAEFLSTQHQPPQLLIGHSLGGTAILAAANSIPSAKAVASIGSPAHPEHILHLLTHDLDSIERDGIAEVTLAGRKFTFKKSFVDDLKNHDIKLNSLRKALMVMHSPVDDTVAVDEAGKIFTAAMHPKSFVSLDNADHLLNNKADAEYAAKVIAEWSQRYISAPLKNNQDISNAVTVSANTNAGFLCSIQAREHTFIADEPVKLGGSNRGATPYDFLAGALGACTAMTLNMYARHKKLNLESVGVTVSHDRIHAIDCHDCEKQSGQVDLFTRDIKINGDLSADQTQRLLQIADRCPVHKTLENEIKIETKLAG